MKLKLLLIATICLFGAISIHAQTITKITGQIKDNAGKPLIAATIMLQSAKDSSLVKTAVSDSKGNYEMAAIKPGRYFLSSSVVNMQKTSSTVFEVKEYETLTAPDITTQAAPKNLEGVTVSTKKPMVEVKADKMIINVEGTINAVGNDGLELLRKAPGVMLDKDDNISLSGKNGVRIFIDGKPSPLAGADLASYLKSLQSVQIESIEIITNPSAKYEAAGNAGIINIKLKKNMTIGTNGSVNAGYNIGTYAKYNGGFALNHRNTKMNIFGNYNFSKGLNEVNIVSNRIQADTTFYQTNRITNRNKGANNFKAGIDYFIDKKSTIGFVATGNVGSNETKTEGPMLIIYNPTDEISRVLYATGDNKTKRNNVNFNLNYRYAVTGGKELNIDADYNFYNIRNDQFQPNTYFDKDGNELNSNVYHMISPTDITIFSVKSDYEQNFMKGRLGFGGKIAFVTTNNDFRRYNVYDSAEVYDKDRSNRFVYKENINAAYVNYNRSFKGGFVVQAGIRVENTNSKGTSSGLKYDSTIAAYKNYDSVIDRNYVDVFPSAAVTYTKSPTSSSQWGLTYSRRIDRPAYQDLNPFEFKLNDYTFMKGNTQLRPQYTNSFGLTHTYKYKLNTRLNYSHVKDIFTLIPDTTETSKSFLTKKNLANQDVISLNVSYPFQWKWYSAFGNVNSFYSHYKADVPDVVGNIRKIDISVFAYSFYVQNSFKLGKGYTAELTGFYNSPSVWQGTFKSKAIYSVDGGFQKTILKGKGTVKASVSDIFNTMQFRGSSDFSGQQSTFRAKWESRQFKLSANIRFGNNQVKASRQRKSAIEDENKRTENSGGIGGTN